MKRRETCRSDSRLSRSEYCFWENPSWYCMETGTILNHHKPGQIEIFSKKIEDYTMYRSCQGLIDVQIKYIIDGLGDYEDFRQYENFMSEEEKIKCLQGLDEEDRQRIIKECIKDILNGCGDYRDFNKIYKDYMSEKDINECLEAFKLYY